MLLIYSVNMHRTVAAVKCILYTHFYVRCYLTVGVDLSINQ